jgi:phage virion morphogenesis protein
MIEIRLEDDAVRNALARLAARLTDMTPVMQEIGEVLMVSTKDRMLAGRSPDGTPFAPRSPATLARYAAMRPPARPRGGPLDLTGTMIGTIFPEAGPTSVRVGSNAIQSAVMHFGQAQGASGRTARGGPIPWGDIPARPFLGLSETDRSHILDIVAEALGEAAG